MKKLFTAFALFLVTISFAQSTAYNSNKKLGKVNVTGEWFNQGVKEDWYKMSTSTVSYVKVYREVKEALDFYGLQFDKPFSDESIISSICKSVEDFEMMHSTIISESSEVKMSWINNKVVIVWYCTTDNYGMLIKEL